MASALHRRGIHGFSQAFDFTAPSLRVFSSCVALFVRLSCVLLAVSGPQIESGVYSWPDHP